MNIWLALRLSGRSPALEPHRHALAAIARKIDRRTSLFAALALVASGACAAAAPPSASVRADYSQLIQNVSQLAEKEMAAHDVVGLSIALVDDQRVVWARGFGHADKSKGLPATPETLFRLGSMTELFTAAAAMQLAEQGKLDIDRPLQRYLPELSVRSRYAGPVVITPRNLMNHHSGLPRDYLQGLWTPNSNPDSLIRAIRGIELVAPPDRVFSYSNLGVSLLGNVIERLAQTPYAAHLEQRLLQPLGMTRSSLAAAPVSHPLMSRSYRKGEETADPALRDIPAGGLVSSATEMSRFLSMVFAGGRVGDTRILRPETLDAMFSPQNQGVELDRSLRIGLGWMLSGTGDIDLRGAGTVAHHAGDTVSFHSQLVALPEHKLGVVVLANSNSARGTVNKLATETLAQALEIKAGIRQPVAEPVELARTPLSPADRQAYAGYYTTQMGPVRVYADGDQLQAEALGRTFRLVPRTDGRLALKYRLLGLIPFKLDALDAIGFSLDHVAGRDILIAHRNGQELMLGEKIEPVPLPAAWLVRQGDYVPSDTARDGPLVRSVHAGFENGMGFLEVRLVQQPDRPLRLAIKPVSDTEALVLGAWNDMGETLRAERSANGAEFLEFSGVRFIRQ
ncbi:serine hydrolase [Methylococcus sp. EFPC2]|uniref:serine hydrolase domain-containing protein n=1 Tax=Methylococcus sp. EFPC2 TaxID=2812648 RepID=UPI0019679555|nr:serine hydrolase domain-containing protein [Methylococcus sp. EFPC2]QSA98283.1 beta-lactamase family protein [Methylococcus sp. EFPC2]